MTPNDDGNQEQPAGGAESPISPLSGGQQGQQLSDVSALVERLEELGKQVKGLQKGTDKRFEQVSGNIKRILELKEAGLNESQIERELWIDSQMKGQDTPPPQPVGNESGGQVPSVESAFRTVEEYGLSTNDPEFIALIRKSPALKPNEFEAKIKDFVLGKVKPPKPANPADVVQPPATNQSSNPGDVSAKIARLAELQKNRTKYKAEITTLEKELEERGWK